MKPYYEQQGVVIYHGDCREVASLLPPHAFDLFLVDPPYESTSLSWDKSIDWLTPLSDAISPTGTMWCFGSMRMLMQQAIRFATAGWRFAQDVVWQKHNGSNFHNDRFRRIHEHVVQFYRVGTQWRDVYKSPVFTMDVKRKSVRRSKTRPPHLGIIGPRRSYQSVDGGPRLMTSIIPCPSCHGYAKHPTQKPVDILKPLIEYSTPPGAMILDPTMGAGSSLVAACAMGRRAVGIEISEKYCEIAAKRLEECCG